MGRLHAAGRRLLVLTKYAIGASVIGGTGFAFWIRNCTFEPLDPKADPLFRHPLLKETNPNNNTTSHDSCVRKIPFSRIKPSLLKDAQQGGTGLVEAFTSGMWGGYGYGIQRNLMRLTKDETNKEDLWTKEEIFSSKFGPGTCITNHFLVLNKSPRSIVMRGCFSPRQSPPSPQDIDNICELSVDLDSNERVATFRFKCVTFNGSAPAGAAEPITGVAVWLHQVYARLLIESGVDNCVQ